MFWLARLIFPAQNWEKLGQISLHQQPLAPKSPRPTLRLVRPEREKLFQKYFYLISLLHYNILKAGFKPAFRKCRDAPPGRLY
jgi:hypothetical protein